MEAHEATKTTVSSKNVRETIDSKNGLLAACECLNSFSAVMIARNDSFETKDDLQ
jgi:hypothetical protein